MYKQNNYADIKNFLQQKFKNFNSKGQFVDRQGNYHKGDLTINTINTSREIRCLRLHRRDHGLGHFKPIPSKSE